MPKPYNVGNISKLAIIKHKPNFKMGRGSTYNDHFYANAMFGITIGENTLIGPYVLIQTSNHVIKHIDIEQNAVGPGSWVGHNRQKRATGAPVIIGDDVWIGCGVTILAGAKVPDKCVIGAGCVLTQSNTQQLKRGDIVVPDVKLRVLDNRKNR